MISSVAGTFGLAEIVFLAESPPTTGSLLGQRWTRLGSQLGTTNQKCMIATVCQTDVLYQKMSLQPVFGHFWPILADFFFDPQGEKMRFRQEDFQTFVAFGIECLEAFFADLL